MMEVQSINSFELENVGFGYEPGKPVLAEVTLNIPAGHIIKVSGDAGSGKSSFLKILAGLIQPKEGDYRLNGESVTNMSFEEFLKFRLNIGYSFDFGGLLSNRTISENLRLPLEYHNRHDPEWIDDRVNHLLELFQLEACAHLRPSAIPGSKRKATVVARSLVQEPELLILDDPTTGLSLELKQLLLQTILELRKSGRLKHVFLVSEDREFFESLVTHEVCLYGAKRPPTHNFNKKLEVA